MFLKNKAGIYVFTLLITFGLVLCGCGPPSPTPGIPTPTPSGTTPTPMSVIEVTSDINTSTTWYSGNVYLIRAYDFRVNAVLTIQPGVVVKFHPSEGPWMLADLGGRIVANGNASNNIIFTSYYDDAHGGDTDGDGSVTAPHVRDWGYVGTNGCNNCSFTYCRFYYSGSSTYDCALQIYDSSATVTNCIFAHDDGFECGVLDADDALDGTIIQSNTFYDNVKPLAIDTTYNIDDSNVFHNPSNPSEINTYQGIFLWSPNHISAHRSWGETEVAFMVEASFWVNIGASLTLADNVVVKFKSGVTLYHNNNISYGTGVAFTSYRDDSWKGDTNGNGPSSGVNGDWDGIYDDTHSGPDNYYEINPPWPIHFDSHNP